MGMSLATAVGRAVQEGRELPKPLPRQLAWQECEVGAIYHFDIPVYLPGGWQWQPAYTQTLDPKVYNPRKLDTDQWLAAAKALGARYALFTATHMGGFLQWQSDLYPYGVKQSPWRGGKGDIVGDFVKSCRRVGIKPGLYIGLRFNAYWKVARQRVNFGRGGDPQKQEQYNRLCERMVTELCTRYGELVEIWFDGGTLCPAEGGPDILPIVEKHQPNAVFYHSDERSEHRWIGNESGIAGYPCWATVPSIEAIRHGVRGQPRRDILAHGDPEGKLWSPAMCDAPLRNHSWCWRPNEERKVRPLSALLNMYYKSVGRNCNLILGVVVDRDGLVPKPDFERCVEFGKEISRRFAQPIAQTRGRGMTIELPLGGEKEVDHAIIMEDVAQGERIRKYVLEGLAGNEWREICRGLSVGHKRIEQFAPVRVSALRLRCTAAVAEPIIRKLAVYYVGAG